MVVLLGLVGKASRGWYDVVSCDGAAFYVAIRRVLLSGIIFQQEGFFFLSFLFLMK